MLDFISGIEIKLVDKVRFPFTSLERGYNEIRCDGGLPPEIVMWSLMCGAAQLGEVTSRLEFGNFDYFKDYSVVIEGFYNGRTRWKTKFHGLYNLRGSVLGSRAVCWYPGILSNSSLSHVPISTNPEDILKFKEFIDLYGLTECDIQYGTAFYLGRETIYIGDTDTGYLMSLSREQEYAMSIIGVLVSASRGDILMFAEDLAISECVNSMLRELMMRYCKEKGLQVIYIYR